MKQPDPSASPLTERQCAIVELAAGGVPQRLIAKRLGLSLRTVEVHASRIRKRLGATTMTQAVVMAIEMKLISIEGRSTQIHEGSQCSRR